MDITASPQFMNLDLSPAIDHNLSMPERVRKLLAEAEEWCRQERGRQTMMAKALGVTRHAVNAWFSEHKKAEPHKNPTAEQALELQAFLNKEKRRK
jgi:DNA-binding XRE family transcriptional regulator